MVQYSCRRLVSPAAVPRHPGWEVEAAAMMVTQTETLDGLGWPIREPACAGSFHWPGRGTSCFCKRWLWREKRPSENGEQPLKN